MKTKREVLEEIHDDILKRISQLEIDTKLYKGLKQEEVVRTEQQQSSMGVVQKVITAKDEIENYQKQILQTKKTLKAIEEMLKRLDK